MELLDYVLDNDDNFWIVSNITDNTYRGYIVYRTSEIGRYNNITKKYYIKDVDKGNFLNIPNSYKRIFKPREFYIENKHNLNGIWKNYVDTLNEIGIPDYNIGIFGSYLIGFDICKDVDFIIYGKDNLNKYYDNIDYIRNKNKVTSISKEHIEHQYNKHKDKFNKECDLKEIISRNWSGIELENGVLSTPRFIDLDNMNIPNKKGIDKKITVKIIDGFYSVMLPRIAISECNGKIYTIVSDIWKFQSFAHIGDIIEIYANVDDDNNLIIMDDKKYYIKYLSKTNLIK